MGIYVKLPRSVTNDFVRKLRLYGARKHKEVVEELRTTAREVQTSARENAPVGTPESTGKKGYIGGTLRARIVVGTERNKGLTQRVEANAEYSWWVEFGTTKMRAQPYLYPALDEHRDELNRRLAQILNSK